MPRRKEDKITLQKETIVTGADGKELRKEKTVQSIISNEPEYVKLYISTLLTFNKLPHTLDSLLLELLSYISYADSDKSNGGQIIMLPNYARIQICNKLNIKPNTLQKSLKRLTESCILKRIGGGAYQVNPYIFGEGEWKDIKNIRATFDFDERTIEVYLITEQTEKAMDNEPENVLTNAR